MLDDVLKTGAFTASGAAFPSPCGGIGVLDPTPRKLLLYLVFKVRLHEATEFEMYHLACVAVSGLLKCGFQLMDLI